MSSSDFAHDAWTYGKTRLDGIPVRAFHVKDFGTCLEFLTSEGFDPLVLNRITLNLKWDCPVRKLFWIGAVHFDTVLVQVMQKHESGIWVYGKFGYMSHVKWLRDYRRAINLVATESPWYPWKVLEDVGVG